MLGRMKCLVGGAVDQGSPRGAARRVSPASDRVHNAAAGPGDKRAIRFRPPDVMETVHEVAVYIHRFHNLDLFQQGYGAMSRGDARFWSFLSRGCLLFLGLVSLFSFLTTKVPSGLS